MSASTTDQTPYSRDDRRLVQVFRSPREEGLYLYVDKQEGLARVPEALLQRFGTPAAALLLMLEPSRKLAHADAGKVLAALRDQGFYLQLPPLADRDMLSVRIQNHKLGH